MYRMPNVKQRKLSPGELAELKRLAAIEAVRARKSRTPLPGSRRYNGMPLRPKQFGYPVVERAPDNQGV